MKKIKKSLCVLLSSVFIGGCISSQPNINSLIPLKNNLVRFPGKLGYEIDRQENQKYNLGFDNNLISLKIRKQNGIYRFEYIFSNVGKFSSSLEKDDFEKIYHLIKEAYLKNINVDNELVYEKKYDKDLTIKKDTQNLESNEELDFFRPRPKKKRVQKKAKPEELEELDFFRPGLLKKFQKNKLCIQNNRKF
ncbi:hypothetical protein KY312_04170 [Candidatus Woesearchaeota archaeon]|nr:hypothetical protein [Candidatus Woesearchaeota archaeon]